MRERQIERRRERAKKEEFKVRNIGPHKVFSHFSIAKPDGCQYKVQIRSLTEQLNTCTCPDYQTNLLGTCKHIEHVLLSLEKKNKRLFRQAVHKGSDLAQVALSYTDDVQVTVSRPKRFTGKAGAFIDKHFTRKGTLREPVVRQLPAFLRKLEKLNPRSRQRIQVADEVLEHASFLEDHNEMEELKGRFVQHARTHQNALKLLDTNLYPYQLDGVLHLAFTRRAMLADDMGLGKTVQAIGACALLQRERGIERVLVITPASLKHQWKREIERFTSLSATVVQGPQDKRALLYAAPTFFTIVNYELLLRDSYAFHHLKPDVIILDEAQRIKNWRTKTAMAVKKLRSKYSFVLTGTPLENRLDELYSVLQFLDPRLLGPLWQFNRRYFILEKKRSGFKVLGHKNLDELRKRIEPTVLRRRKNEVLLDLPDRVDNNYFVPISKLQIEPYEDYRALVSRMAAQAERRPLTDQEFKRLMSFLTKMRVICDSLELHDNKISEKKCEAGAPKLKELRSIISEQVKECGQKAIIFSSFEGMINLISKRVLEPMKIKHVKLSGKVPTSKRGKLIDEFNESDECRVFLSTDAGSTGLNLQAASLVINADVPWNPAVLDQRVSRAHRHGQKNTVNVINLITQGTIEERMLEVMDTKRAIFASVLDDKEGIVDELTFDKSQGLLKRINEILDRAVTSKASQRDELDPRKEEPEPIDLDQIYAQDLEAALNDELLLLRPLSQTPLPQLPNVQAYLVVTESNSSHQETKALTKTFNEHHHPNPPFSAHIFDRQAFEGLRNLFGDAFSNPEKPLHQSTSLSLGRAQDPETESKKKRQQEARQRIERANDRLRLAKVLVDGGFAKDAFSPLEETIHCTIEALAIKEELIEVDEEKPEYQMHHPLWQMELVDKNTIDTQLAGRLSQAREIITYARQKDHQEHHQEHLAEKHLATIQGTAQELLEIASAQLER